MGLQKQVIGVRLSGLDTKTDPKTSILGKLELAENVYGRRRTDQGVEFVKRNGLVHKDPSTTGGDVVAGGKKLGTLGQELLLTDGSMLYSQSELKAEWDPRGRVADISAIVERVESNQGVDPLDTDVAYSSGYLMLVTAREDGAFADGHAEWYLLNATSGARVASGILGTGAVPRYKSRVLATGGKFFVFVTDAAGHIYCRLLDTTQVTIAISGEATVVSDVDATGSEYFDVQYDPTGTPHFNVAYHHDASGAGAGLSFKPWSTSNASGGSAVHYTARNPDWAISFLEHGYANGSFYVAIGTTATGLRCLKFAASGYANQADEQLDAAAVDVKKVTGYFSASGGFRNVFYQRADAGGVAPTYNRKIQGWTDNGGVGAFTLYRSVGLASRAFKIGSKWYLLAHYQGDSSSSKQNSLFLIEMTEDAWAGSRGDFSIAGHLVAGNASAQATGHSMGSVAAISSTKVVLSCSLAEAISVPGTGTTSYASQEGLGRITLDWTGDLIGRSVEHNDVLYLPGACPKTYDGQVVVEAGALVYPEKPATVASNGGSLTLLATYRWCLVYFRYDAQARLWQSAVSFEATVTLTGTQATVTLTIPTLRLTEADPARNVNSMVTPWRIAAYRTKANDPTFRLLTVFENDITVDDISYADSSPDSVIASNPVLYVDTGTVENGSPPAVLAFEAHRGRLFAACGDNTLWHTHQPKVGEAAEFPPAFRKAFDGAQLTGLISLDATLAVAKRAKIYALTGDGPGRDGNNPFTYPDALPGETALVSPRSWVLTPAGAILKSAKGVQLLDRGGILAPLEGADAYDSLTVTGGASLDDRSLACLVTVDGRTLVYDWVFKQWYTWTNHAAVDACIWQGKLCLLASDGTVKVDTSGIWADNGAAITMKVRTTWMPLAGLFGRFKIYALRVLADFLASCTLAVTASIEIYGAQVDESTTFVGTTATKFPIGVPLAQRRCEQLKIEVSETSDTQGLAVSALGMEIGVEGGAAKLPAAQHAG